MCSLLLLLLLTLLILMLAIAGAVLFYYSIKYGIPPMPSSPKRVKQMIQLAEIRDGMTIYDLGCGDGRILRMVDQSPPLKKGARGISLIGIEGNPLMTKIARGINQLSGKSHIQIVQGDIFETDLSQADVIFCYLQGDIMNKIFDQIWIHLKPGCQLIAHAFPLPIAEEQSIEVENGVKIYKYIKSTS